MWITFQKQKNNVSRRRFCIREDKLEVKYLLNKQMNLKMTTSKERRSLGRYGPLSLKQEFLFKLAKQDAFQITLPQLVPAEVMVQLDCLGDLSHKQGTKAALVHPTEFLSPDSPNLGSEKLRQAWQDLSRVVAWKNENGFVNNLTQGV